MTQDSLPTVSFDQTGRLEVDGVSIPTVKIVFTKEVGHLAVLKATVPLISDLDFRGVAHVVYVAEWPTGGQPRMVYGSGDTPLDALRDLVRQLEQSS